MGGAGVGGPGGPGNAVGNYGGLEGMSAALGTPLGSGEGQPSVSGSDLAGMAMGLPGNADSFAAPSGGTGGGFSLPAMIPQMAGSLLGTLLTGGHPIGGIAGAFLGNAVNGLLGGKGLGSSIGNAALAVPGSFAGAALPGMFGIAASALLGQAINAGMQGQTGEGQPPGDVSGIGIGGPDFGLTGMGEAPSGGQMGNVGGPSPVAPAPPPMLSAQPFGWYQPDYFGMKRVNMPWASQAGSSGLKPPTSGNYGGMKRV